MITTYDRQPDLRAAADPDNRVYLAVLETAGELGRLVRAGVLAEDSPAVMASVVAADGLLRIRSGEPVSMRIDQARADAVLAEPAPAAETVRVDDPEVAAVVAKAEEYDAMLYLLAVRLGGRGLKTERHRIGAAVLHALEAAKDALRAVDTNCRLHRTEQERAAALAATPACRHCAQVQRVLVGRAALHALAEPETPR